MAERINYKKSQIENASRLIEGVIKEFIRKAQDVGKYVKALRDVLSKWVSLSPKIKIQGPIFVK